MCFRVCGSGVALGSLALVGDLADDGIGRFERWGCGHGGGRAGARGASDRRGGLVTIRPPLTLCSDIRQYMACYYERENSQGQ